MKIGLGISGTLFKILVWHYDNTYKDFTLLIMTMLITLNTGEITYNDITYNGCYFTYDR